MYIYMVFGDITGGVEWRLVSPSLHMVGTPQAFSNRLDIRFVFRDFGNDLRLPLFHILKGCNAYSVAFFSLRWTYIEVFESQKTYNIKRSAFRSNQINQEISIRTSTFPLGSFLFRHTVVLYSVCRYASRTLRLCNRRVITFGRIITAPTSPSC